MLKNFRRNAAAERLLEEQLYEQVVRELSQGIKRDGLWAKALSNSEASEDKAKSLYIRYRIQSIKDELELSQALNEDTERKRVQNEARKSNAERVKKAIEEKIIRSEKLDKMEKWLMKVTASFAAVILLLLLITVITD